MKSVDETVQTLWVFREKRYFLNANAIGIWTLDSLRVIDSFIRQGMNVDIHKTMNSTYFFDS